MGSIAEYSPGQRQVAAWWQIALLGTMLASGLILLYLAPSQQPRARALVPPVVPVVPQVPAPAPPMVQAAPPVPAPPVAIAPAPVLPAPAPQAPVAAPHGVKITPLPNTRDTAGPTEVIYVGHGPRSVTF